MKKLFISMLVPCFIFVSCSKNQSPEQIVAKEDPDSPYGLVKPDSTFRKALIGKWLLYKEVSDMGPVDVTGKQFIEFKNDANFLQNWYDENGATISSYETRYSIGMTSKTSGFTSVEFKEKRFLNSIKLSNGLDSMQLFNGLGSEYYVKTAK